MASKAGNGDKPRARARFLSYAATVTATLPVDKSTGRVAHAIPFTYAAMAGLNRLVLMTLQKNAGPEAGKAEINLATFRKQVKGRGRWIGDDPQFNATIERLAELGYLDQTNNFIRVEPPMLECLLAHARTIFTFMTRARSDLPGRIPDLDWLLLNEHVFGKFFFGEFGIAWRELREEVNLRLRPANPRANPARKTPRAYTPDYINRNPNLWVAFNAVAIGGPGTGFQLFGHLLDTHKLDQLARKPGEVELAADLLVASGVLTNKDGTYDVAPELWLQTESYRTAIENGLTIIEAGCLALKDRFFPARKPTG